MFDLTVSFLIVIYNLPHLQHLMSEPDSRQSLNGIEDCFKVIRVEQREGEIFVPACVQFKIRNFTEVNFQNLLATVNGVLCINFLIFTTNLHLRAFLCDRLYFNPEQQKILSINRRKKMDRGNFNYVPIMFNKDDNVKIPTTRTKQFQIQSFKTDIEYRKGNKKIKGIRIFHIIRKEFCIEIIKNGLVQNFVAPFDFIRLSLVIALEHMDAAEFKFDQKKGQSNEVEIFKKDQSKYMEEGGMKKIKKISFNLLRIQQPFTQRNMDTDQRVLTMAPMIAYSSEEPFGKYDVVQTQLEGYTHDEREFKQWDPSKRCMDELFQDQEPTQLSFKPFKYAVFNIPLFRYPVVDMMTIFIPLWLLSFVSVYIYFQSTEIMNRIVNVAALMIAYAAIQPIVRENLPQATTITLVDILIYAELLINILFLCKSITLRGLYDDTPSSSLPIQETNFGYNRWQDGLFLASFAISLANVLIVAILIIIYLINRRGYKAKPLPRSVFSISDTENWTLSLLMSRRFARYKQNLIYES